MTKPMVMGSGSGVDQLVQAYAVLERKHTFPGLHVEEPWQYGWVEHAAVVQVLDQSDVARTELARVEQVQVPGRSAQVFQQEVQTTQVGRILGEATTTVHPYSNGEGRTRRVVQVLR